MGVFQFPGLGGFLREADTLGLPSGMLPLRAPNRVEGTGSLGYGLDRLCQTISGMCACGWEPPRT